MGERAPAWSPHLREWGREWIIAAMRQACAILDILPFALNGEMEERDKMKTEKIFVWWVKYVDTMRPRSVRRLDVGQTHTVEHYRNIIHISC